MRSHIALETRALFGVNRMDDLVHNESTAGRIRLDCQDEDRLYSMLASFGMLRQEEAQVQILHNIATKDVATEVIARDLVNASSDGLKQLNQFVEERLMPSGSKKFRDPLHKNKPKTFASLFEPIKTSKTKKEKLMRADRLVLQRLISAYEAGRTIDLDQILKHELLSVPVALAEMNGTLRSGSKALLTEAITSGISCPSTLSSMDVQNSSLIIDGQALVVAIGKPPGLVTFGDFANTFVQAVLKAGANFCRIDVVFDRYYKVSIKSGTRTRRCQGTAPIRRVIEHRNVPLQSNWKNFLGLSENKADLAAFLSQQLIVQAPSSKIIVVAGGFSDEEMAESSKSDVDTTQLEARHEEADTRIILHCTEHHTDNVVVQSRDTDVLVLLLGHYHRMPCTNLWLKAGTAKKRQYVPVHDIVEQISYSVQIRETIPAFHALTGSDTTSYIAGCSKKSAWKTFQTHHQLLENLGKGELTEETLKNAELFVCKLYNLKQVSTTDEARAVLFNKSRSPESLPPTSDALHFHIRRAHYQTVVWRQAHLSHPNLPNPEGLGWRVE